MKKIYLLLFLLVLLFNSCKIDDELVTKNPNSPPIKEQSGEEDEFMNWFHRTNGGIYEDLSLTSASVGLNNTLDSEPSYTQPPMDEENPVAGVARINALSNNPSSSSDLYRFTNKCTIRLTRGITTHNRAITRTVVFRVKMYYYSSIREKLVDTLTLPLRSVKMTIPANTEYKDGEFNLSRNGLVPYLKKGFTIINANGNYIRETCKLSRISVKILKGDYITDSETLGVNDGDPTLSILNEVRRLFAKVNMDLIDDGFRFRRLQDHESSVQLGSSVVYIKRLERKVNLQYTINADIGNAPFSTQSYAYTQVTLHYGLPRTIGGYQIGSKQMTFYSRHVVQFGNDASGKGLSTKAWFNYRDIPASLLAKTPLPNGLFQLERLPLVGISVTPVDDDNSFDNLGSMTYKTANFPERYHRVLQYFQQGK